MLVFKALSGTARASSGVGWQTPGRTWGSFTHAEESGFRGRQQYDAGQYGDSFRVRVFSAGADSMTKGERRV